MFHEQLLYHYQIGNEKVYCMIIEQFHTIFEKLLNYYQIIFEPILNDYYAPPSRPEGPRRCPDRGNAGGALVFPPQLLWLLYALGLYTCRKFTCQIRI